MAAEEAKAVPMLPPVYLISPLNLDSNQLEGGNMKTRMYTGLVTAMTSAGASESRQTTMAMARI